MKVISPQDMSHIESLAYRDGASAWDFMEEAGSGVALFVHDYMERNRVSGPIVLLCGKGNNGGDAFVAGMHLLQLDYEVWAIQPDPLDVCTPLCKQSCTNFIAEGGRVFSSGEFPKSGLIVDGIFGTGFKGTSESPYAELIAAANASRLPIIAVDIPSGLNGDSGLAPGQAIVATETTFLGLPKKGFFFNQGWNHVGKLRYVDFGLSPSYIEEASTTLLMLSEEMLKPLLPPIIRNRHKYQAGYVVGWAGSVELPGAALLSSNAALRAGAGIVRLLHPSGMEEQLSSSPYELIRQSYDEGDAEGILAVMERASALFIGPGLGRTPQVRSLLKNVLPNIPRPCVIDADALTIAAEEQIPFPPQAIITPHHGEMARLLGLQKANGSDPEFVQRCHRYAEEKGVTLVLKGAPTFILHPGMPMMVNPTGDPGMATAGSGDVLTGLISALLAQGASLQNAAALGVYMHGLAGEHAAEEMSSYCLLASDIIYRFPEAFRFIPI